MTETNPYDRLEKIFHEPKRLAIVSALVISPEGKTFADLKTECDLTDGNLSRHLKTLADNAIVAIKKVFVGVRPQTTVELTGEGRTRFVEYLEALEEVLKKAEQNIQRVEERATAPAPDALVGTQAVK